MIEVNFGATEHGKSYHVEKRVLKKRDRVIIYDYKSCFSGDLVDVSTTEKALAAFKKYKDKKRFRIVCRPQRGQDQRAIFEKLCIFAMAIGRHNKNKNWQRIMLALDEADSFCGPSSKPEQLQTLVDWGRHDCVDSVFIARDPNTINNNARRNASSVTCFRLTAARDIQFLRTTFGKKIAEEIETLPKYEAYMWRDNGKIYHINKNGKLKEVS